MPGVWVYQTDPRWSYFVCFHVALFTLSTVRCYGIFWTLRDNEALNLNIIEGSPLRSAGENRFLHWLLDVGQNLHTTVDVYIFTPTIAGVILAVVNGHSYLILDRNECFASLISRHILTSSTLNGR